MALIRFAAAPPDPRDTIRAAADALLDTDVSDPDAVVAAVVAAVAPDRHGLGGLTPRAAERLWGFGRDGSGLTPAALTALVRRLALVAAGRALANLDVESIRQAADWRTRWAAAVETEIADAPPEVANALMELGTAVSRTLTERGVRAPEILELRGEEYDNSVAAAYALYNDLGRADELEALNGSDGPILGRTFDALSR